MYYFAYGSNMSIRRLRVRVPSAMRHGVAILQKHLLKFHKVSQKDGSAKCDAKETGRPEDRVIGVIFDLPESQKPELDRQEGLGCGYGQKDVSVQLSDSTVIESFTYFATRIDPDLKPWHWYKEHVLKGAVENGLPVEYIQEIEAVESIADPDVERHKRELTVYRLR